MKTAQCPSCGAEVRFQSASSVMAVCDYCRSTLVRHDLDIENIGKMAELAEDASPLRRGVAGVWKGVNFSLIGRIQLKYDAGIWNEWYALFDDGRTGWVSEGSGLAYITFPVESKGALPAWDALEPDQEIKIGGKPYTLTNKEAAQVIAGEGELPFRVGEGYAAPAADLRAEDDSFISIDYSDATPRVYAGFVTSYAALKLNDASAAAKETSQVAAKAFNCPSCGAPAQIHAGEIECYACPGCGTTVDVANPGLKIIAAARKGEKIQPRIPFGTEFTLRGDKLMLIGFMRRKTRIDGITYPWDEYLLYGDKAGFCWLIEDGNGHWNYGRATAKLPQTSGGGKVVSPVASFDGQVFKHFQSCKAEVAYVAGEFNWRVKVDDVAQCDDYIAPPLMLSKERTGNEVAWTLCEYLPVDELRAACPKFIPGHLQSGVGANQPSPYSGGSGRFWGLYFAVLVLAFVLQLFFTGKAANEVLLNETLELAPGRATTHVSKPFKLARESNLEVISDVMPLENSWAYLAMTLVNRETGEEIAFGREVSYYHGYDSDGSWSEGGPHDEAFFTAVPAGEYVLEIEAEPAPEQRTALQDQLRVVRDVPVWANFWVMIFALLLFPIWATWRSFSFEIKRWSESDHPLVTESSDSDDD